MVEESVEESLEAAPEASESVVSEEEGEAEEISVNVQMLEVMLERLDILEKLARGEVKLEDAQRMLESIVVPESEKRRRRRRQS